MLHAVFCRGFERTSGGGEREKEKNNGKEIERERGVIQSGTICSHAGRQAVFEIGSERLQTKGGERREAV